MYNYIEVMKEDILNWVDDSMTDKEFPDREDMEEFLNDALWAENDVTGNGDTNGYFVYHDEAKNAVTDNMELCKEAVAEFGLSANTIVEHFLDEDWAYFDATIRCYLLGQAIHEALDQIYESEDN